MVKPRTYISKESLVSQTGFLLAMTVTGYGFGYLYLVFMGRFLGPETFGLLGALFAIFYIACLVGQALRGAIATNVAELKAKAGESAAVSAFIKLAIKISLICILPAIVLIIAAKPISSFFHLTYNTPIIILAFSLFTALALDIVLGLQQGIQKFRQLGIIGYLTSQGMKLVLAVVFVLIGWNLSGAVAALLGSTAIATVAGLFLVREKLASTSKDGSYSFKMGPVILPTLILAVFLSMPASVDVMLVTHFFGGEEAGFYNAAATIGKVVFFLPMAVSFILLPKATESHALRRDSRRILLWSLFLAFLLSACVVLVCWLFPKILITLFFGETYLESVKLIGLYTAAMLFFSLDVVLIHYSLAVRNLWMMLLADLITIAEVVAIVLVHQSLLQIIWILFMGNLLILLICLPCLLLRRVNAQ